VGETTLVQVKELVTQLSASERAQLAAWLEPTLTYTSTGPPPRSHYGIWADLSPMPTDADLDDARREMWANFPREYST